MNNKKEQEENKTEKKEYNRPRTTAFPLLRKVSGCALGTWARSDSGLAPLQLVLFSKSTTGPSIHGLKCGIALFIQMFQMQGFPYQLWRLNSLLLHAFPLVTQPVLSFGSGPLLFSCCPPVSGFPPRREGQRQLVRAPVLTWAGERDMQQIRLGCAGNAFIRRGRRETATAWGRACAFPGELTRGHRSLGDACGTGSRESVAGDLCPLTA